MKEWVKWLKSNINTALEEEKIEKLLDVLPSYISHFLSTLIDVAKPMWNILRLIILLYIGSLLFGYIQHDIESLNLADLIQKRAFSPAIDPNLAHFLQQVVVCICIVFGLVGSLAMPINNLALVCMFVLVIYLNIRFFSVIKQRPYIPMDGQAYADLIEAIQKRGFNVRHENGHVVISWDEVLDRLGKNYGLEDQLYRTVSEHYWFLRRSTFKPVEFRNSNAFVIAAGFVWIVLFIILAKGSLLNTFAFILSAIVTASILAYKHSRRLEGDVHAS